MLANIAEFIPPIAIGLLAVLPLCWDWREQREDEARYRASARRLQALQQEMDDLSARVARERNPRVGTMLYYWKIRLEVTRD